MDADQHVRRALILQLAIGLILSARFGLLPNTKLAIALVVLVAVCWLILMEMTHHFRNQALGPGLARIDRAVRYLVILGLIGTAVAVLTDKIITPNWLAWKLGLFAVIMLCGVTIRLVVIHFFAAWARIGKDGSSEALESTIRSDYYRSTAVLGLLWLAIVGIVVVSVMAQPR